MKLKSLVSVALLSAAASLHAATVNVSGSITADTHWTADNEYKLSGYVFVTNEAVLTIDPGTVIKGEVSSGAGAAALIITKDSKIMAEGTAEAPIVFTSELDPLDGSLGPDRKGLWGGVILLGNATINSRADGETAEAPVSDQIEGLSVTADQIPLITFGGTNDEDSSGVMTYVSIRHGGADLGAGNEINGLTGGGVGSGTTLSYIEVFANYDDGFEFFGGTVSPDHLVAAFCGDDSFDFDTGFRGTLQYLFTVQVKTNEEPYGDKAIEWDGETSSIAGTPKGNVWVSNLTAIGIGDSSAAAPINPRDNATVHLVNSVFVDFKAGIEIEKDIGDVMPEIKSNVWFSHDADSNTTTAWGTSGSSDDLDATSYFTDATLNNMIADPMMLGVSRAPLAQLLDPRSADKDNSPIWTTTVFDASAAGAEVTDYVGAFGNNLWIQGWTNLALAGYVSSRGVFVDENGEDPAGDVTVTTPVVRNSTSKPVNISTRGFVGTGNSALTAGFVVNGSQVQSLLIRVAGPTLAADFGLSGTLSAAQLTLYRAGENTPLDSTTVVRTQTIAYSAELGGFPLNATGDAAMLATLAPGAYTVVVSGVNDATGIAIVEVYELD
ncbi:hypothetical protein [Actomonas aquatica]|uniref:Uncharacterized protein n=1 Tax=Actomonas aquatica TaxID=2866162 RepID=A0ABZ1CCI2_9BACT|nr:hypothetical protein [Opitutus sp. WL0086]WRQ89147.1 hypothetical protein K1X11_006985 [Opitutus sp. WL0086]